MKLKVGIIGTGWIAELHLEALKKIGEVKIAAVAGRNLPRAQALAAGCGAVAYEDYHDMLSKEKPDAVFILLPPDAHGEVEEACAARVPAVFIEKPVCNHLDAARRIGKVFEEKQTLVSVGYMNRYRAGAQYVRKAFASSEQKPVLANGWWVTQMPGVAWWRDRERSGGQFVEQCTHLVDLARYLMGEIAAVHAFAARGFVTGIEGYTVDDAITVNVRFASGAVGNFVTGSFPLNGTDARSGIGLTLASRTLKCEFSGWGMDLNIMHGGKHTEEIKSEEDIFEIEDRAFVDAILHRDPAKILSSYADGIASLAVGCAANESLRTGATVRL
jgi:predicted dehydrogenase